MLWFQYGMIDIIEDMICLKLKIYDSSRKWLLLSNICLIKTNFLRFQWKMIDIIEDLLN